MNIPKNEIPDDILRDSILAHVAGAYFAAGKKLERKTQCSPTRGFILAIKLMAKEGLVSERKAKLGRAIHVRITAQGARYREGLIKARVAADAAVRQQMTPKERATLLRLLKIVAACEL